MPVHASALKLLINGGMQVNDRAPVTQILAVKRVKDGAPACCQYYIWQLCQFVNDDAFPFAEAGLTFKFKNERDIHAGARFDFMITVMKGQAELFRQLSTDGGFAGSHGTRQKQTARRFHAGQI